MQLTQVKGIGRWTAEMFLIFSLGRLDVLPVGDLGLKKGIRSLYSMPDLPEKDEIEELAEKWKPYRTVATWYIWKSLNQFDKIG
jgi:DNA-3-methyladenine glycosylase II